jgi:hypothetical protein
VLKSIEAERQLMGLDAPTKIAPTTPDGRPLSREERLIHINAILIEKFGAVAVLGNGEEQEVLERDTKSSADAAGGDARQRLDADESALASFDADSDAPSTPG